MFLGDIVDGFEHEADEAIALPPDALHHGARSQPSHQRQRQGGSLTHDLCQRQQVGFVVGFLVSAEAQVDPCDKVLAVLGANDDGTTTNGVALAFLKDKLRVMDANAIVLCRDQRMPIRVFNVFGEGNLVRIVRGEAIGTLVS